MKSTPTNTQGIFIDLGMKQFYLKSMMKFRDLTKFITRALAVAVVGFAATTTTSCAMLDDAEYPVINELIAPMSDSVLSKLRVLDI